MNQEEAIKALQKNTRVWIEINDPPKIQVGKLVKQLDRDFFLFRSSAGIMDYAVYAGQIYPVQEKAKTRRLAIFLRKLNFTKEAD